MAGRRDDNLVLGIPEDVLRRHGARILDPLTAPRGTTPQGEPDRAPGTTAYLTGSLLVRGLPRQGAADRVEALRTTVRERGVRLEVDPADVELEQRLEANDGAALRALGRRDPDLRRRRGSAERQRQPLSRQAARDEELEAGRRAFDRAYQSRVRIVMEDGTAPVDPWELLLAERGQDVDLEHLLFAAGGGGFWTGHGGGGFWTGHGGGGFWTGHSGGGGLGAGSRTPVSLAVPDPWVAPPEGTRPVCVVVPDTGLGDHPWFRADDTDPRQKAVTECACIVRTLGTTTVGPDGGLEPDPEGTGVRDDLTGALDRLSGHGTFIAGIVRQTAPSAQIVALPVMDSSGAVAEGVLYRTLAAVLAQHLEAEAADSDRSFADKDGGLVDVVNLSMGFYHQDGELDEDHPMKQLLDRFAEAGIIVVAAAGNDATRQPLYPAGWAVRRGAAHPSAPTTAPLVSVGAFNPDGVTVALFSNAGEWVTTHAPGVNVVSTLPTTFRASDRAVVSTPGEDGLMRATVDLGHLGQGFAVWSGTSFAAPHVAGWLAARLATEADDSGTEDGRSARASRAWSALSGVLRDGGAP